MVLIQAGSASLKTPGFDREGGRDETRQNVEVTDPTLAVMCR